MKTIDLNGKWQLQQADSNDIITATVPGCNFLDLLNENTIPDPFIACNEKAVQWIGEKNWIYSKSFFVDEDFFLHKNKMIVFEMLDTLAEIFINDNLLAKTQNAYRTYKFNINDLLKSGENKIKIVFYSPLDYIKQWDKTCPLPNTTEGEAGSCHIRKPAYHFGWDWAPHLLQSGIIKPVKIIAYDNSFLESVFISQKHDNNRVTLSLIPSFLQSSCNVNYKITYPDGKIFELNTDGNPTDFVINDPLLWWTHDLGEQPLYNIKCTTDEGQELEYNIGLRTIQLDKSYDQIGSDFCFVLNGKRIFAKGANWVPTDSFISRTSAEQINDLVGKAKTANMNMLRVWGGGYYESDSFYDACDNAGILVWQDFMFACSPFPYNREDFLSEICEEVKDNVIRLRNHASLALWCGNNEIEAMHGAWIYRRDIIALAKDFFYDYLPQVLRKYDYATPYHQGSPCGNVYLKDHNSDNFGDTHLWKVWHGMRPADYLTKRNTRFCSEYGLQSFPHLNTIKKINKGVLPDSLNDTVVKTHQKAVLGNQRTLYYVMDRYFSPLELWDITYLTQLSQADCAEIATDYWRTKKGVCNGSLYWQYNDCWGVTSWSGLDYYNNPKAVQYRARHFNAPLNVSIVKDEKTYRIYANNDTLSEKTITVRYGIATFDGKSIYSKESEILLSAQSTFNIASIVPKKLTKSKNIFIFAEATIDGKVISLRKRCVYKEKNCDIIDPCLQYNTSYKDGIYTIYLSTKYFARGVELALDGFDVSFSDNYFDLMPNENITINVAVSSDKDTLDKALSVRSLSDIKAKNSRFIDNLSRIKTFLTPFNFVNWLYRTSE